MVATLILLSQGRGEGVAMATPILLLGGRRQGDYGPCLTLFLGSGGVFSNLWQGMGKVWLWPMLSLFQKEGWRVTMTSPLVLLRSGGL